MQEMKPERTEGLGGAYSYPCRGHRKWVRCVEASFSIVDWPAIPENGDLKVLHHRVHHLSIVTGKRMLLCMCNSHLLP